MSLMYSQRLNEGETPQIPPRCSDEDGDEDGEDEGNNDHQVYT